MNDHMVYYVIIIVLFSTNICNGQIKSDSAVQVLKNASDGKPQSSVKTLKNHHGKEVMVSNWISYGWDPKREVDAENLKKVLNALAIFERGSCPFGEGKCESMAPVSVLAKLINDMLNKSDNDCNGEDCLPQVQNSEEESHTRLLEKSKSIEAPNDSKEILALSKDRKKLSGKSKKSKQLECNGTDDCVPNVNKLKKLNSSKLSKQSIEKLTLTKVTKPRTPNDAKLRFVKTNQKYLSARIFHSG